MHDSSFFKLCWIELPLCLEERRLPSHPHWQRMTQWGHHSKEVSYQLVKGSNKYIPLWMNMRESEMRDTSSGHCDTVSINAFWMVKFHLSVVFSWMLTMEGKMSHCMSSAPLFCSAKLYWQNKKISKFTKGKSDLQNLSYCILLSENKIQFIHLKQKPLKKYLVSVRPSTLSEEKTLM